MIDKVQEIREEVEKRFEQIKNSKRESDSGAFYQLKELLEFIDSLQEEPVDSVWHDKDEEPCEDRQVLICLLGNCYVDFYHKEDKRFYMFGNPKHYLCEVDKWAYIDDIINPSNVQRTTKNWKEPVSKELEYASEKYACRFSSSKYGHDKVKDAFIAGDKWKEEQLMKDAFDVEVKVDAGGYPYIPQIELYDYDKDMPLAKKGDKYKVILIKED